MQIAEIAHECFENGQILGKSIVIALAQTVISGIISSSDVRTSQGYT